MNSKKESVTKKLQGLSLLSPNFPSQINIFSQLHNIEELTDYDDDNTQASSYGLYTTLVNILGNSAHIVHPDLSSVSAVMSRNSEERKEAAINYAKAIAGYETNNQLVVNGFIHQDGGQLVKPIVMLLNTHSAKAKNALDTQAVGGVHWGVCVVLPKIYRTLRGIQINNAHEKIYFIDPLYQDVKLPQEFKAILKFGAKGIIPQAGMNVYHNIPPAFPEAEFIDCTNVFQQAVGSLDCGWWSLYNALEIVATGNITFLGRFNHSQYQTNKRQNREIASRLRGLFSHLANEESNHPQKSKSQKEIKSGIPKNEMAALQIAIEESIKTFNTYQARSDAVHGRRGNDYQTLVLLYCALENYFKGIQFTLKTEVDDGTDIDDLELQVGNQLKKYQIKHASNKGDYYTPADLLHVTKSKLVNSKLGDSTKGGAPLVHFFESWYLMKYTQKDHKGLQIEYALYTNYDFNAGCLVGLLNPITKTFHLDFFGANNTANGKKLNANQQKFKNNLIQLIRNLKIIKNLKTAEKDQKIIEFFSEFKFLLKQPYIDELEKKIRLLLSAYNFNEDSIYHSFYYQYNLWLRTRLKDSKSKDERRALTITDAITKEMLLELEVKCKLLQRLIGQSQYYMNKMIQIAWNSFVISRKNEQDQLNQALITSRMIFIKGEKGTGKSVFIKNFIEINKWQESVLFFKDEDDFKIVSNVVNHVNLADFLKYFSGIKLIVIDSAETWVSNYSKEKKKIFQALLLQDKIPVVCTITENIVENFIEKYGDKNKKNTVISINPLTEIEVNTLLKPYISEPALLVIQGNKAVMNTCRILFWLNHFIKHCDTLSSELSGLLNEGAVIEYISKKTVKGRDKKISDERKLIWLSICVQSQANINVPVKLQNRNMRAINSLEQDQVLIKNPEGNYTLQHDLYYDVGMRFYYDKKRKEAFINNDFSSLLEFVDKYIKSSGIQFRVISDIENFYQLLQNPIPTISIYICAAIFAKHDEALKYLLNLIDPKTLINTYFMGSYYSDFYMVAICADNTNAVPILASKNVPFFFDNIEYQSSGNFETDDDKNSTEEYSESDDIDAQNSDGSCSTYSSQSISTEDPYADWYKYPVKYCFANFRSEYYDIEYDLDGEIVSETEEFNEQPNDNHYFQYFVSPVKTGSYKVIKNLIVTRPDIILRKNNFEETPLHYAAKINDLDLLNFLLEFPQADKCVNANDQLGETPLHNACYVGNINIVLSLLKAGAEPNSYNNYKVTPFHIAIAKQDRQIIELLFKYGADTSQYCYYQDCSLVQFIADVDNSEHDDFILFLMKLFNYGCCTMESLQDINGLQPQEKKELIEKYHNLTQNQFNEWVEKQYSSQEILCKKIVMKFNNVRFAYYLEDLLNYTKLSDDHSYILYHDEASQFEYYLENGDYFEAIDCLNEIDADDIKSVFDQMDEHNNDLKEEMINHLTETHQAWDQLAVFAFCYNDEKAMEEIRENDYLDDKTIPMLLSVALDNKDDDMFSAICDEVQWNNDEIITAIKAYFGNSNESINEMLLKKAALSEESSYSI